MIHEHGIGIHGTGESSLANVCMYVQRSKDGRGKRATDKEKDGRGRGEDKSYLYK